MTPKLIKCFIMCVIRTIIFNKKIIICQKSKRNYIVWHYQMNMALIFGQTIILENHTRCGSGTKIAAQI